MRKHSICKAKNLLELQRITIIIILRYNWSLSQETFKLFQYTSICKKVSIILIIVKILNIFNPFSFPKLLLLSKM